MKPFPFFLIATSLICFLGGCTPDNGTISPTTTPPRTTAAALLPTPPEEDDSPLTSLQDAFSGFLEEKIRYPEPQVVAPGITLHQRSVELGEQPTIITIVHIEPEAGTFRVLQDTAKPKAILTWQEETNATIVINGNYFMESMETAGYLISDGEPFGTLKTTYNGMFHVEKGTPAVTTLSRGQYTPTTSTTAALTNFPMLLIDGKNVLSGRSQTPGRRSVVAEDVDGNILLMATHQSNLTLYELAEFLEQSDLNIVNALNLDGGGSTGLAVESSSFSFLLDSFDIVPNVLVFSTL